MNSIVPESPELEAVIERFIPRLSPRVCPHGLYMCWRGWHRFKAMLSSHDASLVNSVAVIA